MPRRRWKLEYAARFVAKWEGFIEVAYLDTIASPPVATGGFGHSEYAAPPHVHVGDRWTREYATEVLTHDLRATARAVSDKIHGHLTFRQRIALISAAYNLGTGILDVLAPMINAGRMKAAANKLLEYDHAGGVVVEGLSNRRKAERWLMLHNHLPNPHRARPIHPKRKGKK
ncbi:MAG: lysozyme [Solirubrobacterales bacterium]